MNMTTPGALARFARRIAGIVAECDYAQRRMLALRTMPDMYLPRPGQAPGGLPGSCTGLRRAPAEPAAAGRAHGRLVR